MSAVVVVPQHKKNCNCCWFFKAHSLNKFQRFFFGSSDGRSFLWVLRPHRIISSRKIFNLSLSRRTEDISRSIECLFVKWREHNKDTIATRAEVVKERTVGDNGLQTFVSFPFLLWPGNGGAFVNCCAEVVLLLSSFGPGRRYQRSLYQRTLIINKYGQGWMSSQSTSSRWHHCRPLESES